MGKSLTRTAEATTACISVGSGSVGRGSSCRTVNDCGSIVVSMGRYIFQGM